LKFQVDRTGFLGEGARAQAKGRKAEKEEKWRTINQSINQSKFLAWLK